MCIFLTDAQTASDYTNFLRKNYKIFTSIFDVASDILPLLVERQVISAKEREHILSQEDRIQRNETLLSVIHRKSPDDFIKFKTAWEETFPGSSDLTDMLYGKLFNAFEVSFIKTY